MLLCLAEVHRLPSSHQTTEKKMSLASTMAPASVITAALRAFAVLFSILSGKFYFKEKKFYLKLFLFLCVAIGLVLLMQ